MLPCAIDYETCVAIGLRGDNLVEVIAADYDNQRDRFSPRSPHRAPPQPALERLHPRRGETPAGTGPRPARPQPGGLRQRAPGGRALSSASLEVAIGQAFKEAQGLAISQAEIALNGQQAENQFVGCNCGIMDQMISASGGRDHALLLDCRSSETRLIPMPTDLAVLIVNSNVPRPGGQRIQHPSPAVRNRRPSLPGSKALRDLDLAAGSGQGRSWTRPAIAVPATWSARTPTLAAADALAQGDLVRLGELMGQSHAAMRDDFEITVPPIDGLVEIIKARIGSEGGVRMTGGGFGGCVVALLRPEKVAEVIAVVEADGPARFGLGGLLRLPCQRRAGRL